MVSKVSRIVLEEQLGKADRPMTVADRLAQFINRIVVIEGTFPVPVGIGANGKPQVAYAPAKGKLVAVYADGFEIKEAGDAEGTVYLFENVRSVAPFSEIAMPNTGVTGIQS